MSLHCVRCGATTELAPGAPSVCGSCGAPIVPVPAAGAPPKTSGLAIASLVAGLLFCLPGLNMIAGIGLGIAALVAINNRPRELKGQGLAIAGIVLSVGSLFFGGILAAIAIPNFIKFQERAKNAEARALLKALATSESAYFAEHDTFIPFGPVPATLGSEPATVPASALPQLGFVFHDRVRFQYEAVMEGAPKGADAVLVLRARRPSHGGTVEFTERVTASGPGPVEGKD